MFIFPVQLTTSRIGNLTRLIHTLLYVMAIHCILVLVAQTTVVTIFSFKYSSVMIVLIVLVLCKHCPKAKGRFCLGYLNVTVNKWQVLIYQTSHVVLTGDGAPEYTTQN